MKRIVTIQDVSCVGKCSVTVALPVVSAMGVECAVIPTAVLSTHTAFKGFTFCDLTREIAPITEHWKRENFAFDAIYTGYLGSFEQLNLVREFIQSFKTDSCTVFIDPVMGDYGKLYPGFTPEFAHEMGKLCGSADIIVPNMTEAVFMLDMPYRETYDENYVREILCRLAELGTKKTVLTGVNFVPGKLGVMSYDSETSEFYSYFNEKIDVNYHGTGDVYASACIGALMNGFPLEESLAIAADYTVECIRQTQSDPAGRWYGVNFEMAVPYLLKRIGR